MTPTTAPDDELLAALDQFTNTVCWLRDRTRYLAAEALTEAFTEWTNVDAAEPAALGDLTAALIAFTATVASGPSEATAAALADALQAWTASVSAEHHQSRPFQRLHGRTGLEPHDGL